MEKEITHEEWMENVKKLNAGQPSLQDLVNEQVKNYEAEKAANKEK